MKRLDVDFIRGCVAIILIALAVSLVVYYIFPGPIIKQTVFEKSLKVGVCYSDIDEDPFAPKSYRCVTDIKGSWALITNYESKVWNGISYMHRSYSGSSNMDNWFTLKASEVKEAGTVAELINDPRPEIKDGKWYSDGRYDIFVSGYLDKDKLRVAIKRLSGAGWNDNIGERCRIHGLDDYVEKVDDLREAYTEVTDDKKLVELNNCKNGVK